MVLTVVPWYLVCFLAWFTTLLLLVQRKKTRPYNTRRNDDINKVVVTIFFLCVIAMLSFSSLIPLLGLGLAELLLLRFFILFLLLFFFCFLFLLLESLFDDLLSLLHFLLDLSSRWRGPLHPWVLRDALEGIPLLWLKL